MRNVATVIFTGEWQVVREIDKLPSSEFEGPVTASPPRRLPILPGFLGLPLPALGLGLGVGVAVRGARKAIPVPWGRESGKVGATSDNGLDAIN